MAEKIVMLALSPTMESGTIVKWHKNAGDHVKNGDILCEVETDKATMDYESVNEGSLLAKTVQEGAKVNVGELIAIIGNPGEPISSLLEIKAAAPSQKESTPKKDDVESVPNSKIDSPATKEANNQPDVTEHLPSGVKASPLARAIASQKGVDIRLVKGSGPGGRVVRSDVEHFTPVSMQATPSAPVAFPSSAADQTVPISDKRRIIAQRMSDSMFTAPHFYVTVVIPIDAILNQRKTMNEHSETKVSLNAFLIKFVAEALRRNPSINASWAGDTIIRHSSIDIGIAVAQKEGLITPIVKECSRKGILTIDTDLRDLVERARKGKLTPEEYTGATFTISNLGSYGIREFTAIINPPASAILAIGELYKEPIFNDNGTVSSRTVMNVTLSADHRILDGAVVAEFMRDLKQIMENPFILFQ